MNGANVDIRDVWKAEQEILDVVHDICVKNNIKYSLAYGTLIGAVRHGGFIPWDDDIDIMMPREDYERFLSIWNDVSPKGYILQNTGTDFDFTQNFTKIRKDHTTFLHSLDEGKTSYHKGIFVDIFPGDRVAPKKISRIMQFIACAINLLYSRGFISGTGGAMGLLERFLLKTSKENYIKRRKSSENFIRRWNNRNDCKYVFPSTIGSSKVYYPSNLFDDMSTIRFNDKEYKCVGDVDATLRAEYGDYMQLPPEEDRVWKHHPVIIDFEHNYEDLEQKRK